MAGVFADALSYIALLVPRDTLNAEALDAGARLQGIQIITSEPVLVEVLAHVSGLGAFARAEAAGIVDDLRADPHVMIIPQTPELFEDGLALYRARLDKGYSLTDCMSMSICRRFAITEVLTHDRHFEQEGFAILL